MKHKYVLVCVGTLTAIAIAFAVNGLRQASGYPHASAQQTLQSNIESGPVRNVRLTLFEQGIRPAETRIQAGLVNIAIEDKTTDGDGLLISRVDAGYRNTVGTVRKWQNFQRGRAQLRFTPGTYELQDSVRPSNKALLVVEP